METWKSCDYSNDLSICPSHSEEPLKNRPTSTPDEECPTKQSIINHVLEKAYPPILIYFVWKRTTTLKFVDLQVMSSTYESSSIQFILIIGMKHALHRSDNTVFWVAISHQGQPPSSFTCFKWKAAATLGSSFDRVTSNQKILLLKPSTALRIGKP